MARPVDARQRELQRRRIHREDPALESEDESRVLAVLGEPGARGLQVFEHPPIQVLGHGRVAGAVGVREGVAGGRRRAADPHEFGVVDRQPVADLVQTQRVRRMAVHQRQHMAGLGESARVDFVLPLQHGNHVARNQVAHLPEHGTITACWPGRSALAGAGRLAVPRLSFIHSLYATGQRPPGQRFSL